MHAKLLAGLLVLGSVSLGHTKDLTFLWDWEKDQGTPAWELTMFRTIQRVTTHKVLPLTVESEATCQEHMTTRGETYDPALSWCGIMPCPGPGAYTFTLQAEGGYPSQPSLSLGLDTSCTEISYDDAMRDSLPENPVPPPATPGAALPPPVVTPSLPVPPRTPVTTPPVRPQPTPVTSPRPPRPNPTPPTPHPAPVPPQTPSGDSIPAPLHEPEVTPPQPILPAKPEVPALLPPPTLSQTRQALLEQFDVLEADYQAAQREIRATYEATLARLAQDRTAAAQAARVEAHATGTAALDALYQTLLEHWEVLSAQWQEVS